DLLSQPQFPFCAPTHPPPATLCSCLFCCTAAPPSQIHTLSLHDALPIFDAVGDELHSPFHCLASHRLAFGRQLRRVVLRFREVRSEEHTSELQYANISYAVFCLKKKTEGEVDTSVSDICVKASHHPRMAL